MAEDDFSLTPDSTILEVVSRYRHTEEVFRRFDAAAGVCLLCQALFDPLGEVAAKYHLSLPDLLAELQAAIGGAQGK